MKNAKQRKQKKLYDHTKHTEETVDSHIVVPKPGTVTTVRPDRVARVKKDKH